MRSPHRARTDDSTLFALFVVDLPSIRAQSIQVVHSLHALARRGWRVRLWFRSTGGDPWEGLGLSPHPRLTLCELPKSRSLGSLRLRADIVRWGLENAGRGVFLARSKRYARLAAHLAPQIPLVLEAHEVDSLQHVDQGGFFGLERAALAHATGLICNCEGVLEGLSWLHPLPEVRRVVHNAWVAGPDSPSDGAGVALAGSLLGTKDPWTVADAAREVGPITVYGLRPAQMGALERRSEDGLVHAGPVPPGRLVETLRRHHTLVLPLGRGWFGERFTSPLKAFAYQASRVPFVGADTPALRRAAPGAFEPYTPGDSQSLVRAIRRLERPRIRARRLREARRRTWESRAIEVEEVLRAVR